MGVRLRKETILIPLPTVVATMTAETNCLFALIPSGTLPVLQTVQKLLQTGARVPLCPLWAHFCLTGLGKCSADSV